MSDTRQGQWPKDIFNLMKLTTKIYLHPDKNEYRVNFTIHSGKQKIEPTSNKCEFKTHLRRRCIYHYHPDILKRTILT
jgi:hypothetical protein